MKSRRPLVLTLLATLFLSACGGGAASLDDQGSYFAPTAAVVCGAIRCQKIAESRVNSRLSSAVEDPQTAGIFRGPQGAANRLDAQREILSDLIRQEVGLQMARRMKITSSDEDVERRLESLKANYENEKAFEAALEADGLTEEELQGFLQNDSVLARVRDTVGRNAKATDQEIEQYYQLNKSQFDEQVKIAHVVVCANFNAEERTCSVSPADQETANQVAERARNGEDFGALAREFSVDTVSKERNGELDFFSRGDVVRELEEASFNLNQVGDISDPVQTPFGFHVVKLLAIGRPFEEAKPLISNALATQKANAAFEEWLIDAVKAAQVKVNPKLGVFDDISQSVIPKSAALARAEADASPAP